MASPWVIGEVTRNLVKFNPCESGTGVKSLKMETMNRARIASAILAAALGFAAIVKKVPEAHAESVRQ